VGSHYTTQIQINPYKLHTNRATLAGIGLSYLSIWTKPMTKANHTVLLVDDSAIIVERLKLMLEQIETIHEIRDANSYANAVILIEEAEPDIAILDINMPDKNGIELLRYVKNRHPDTIVIMMSNQADEFYRRLCYVLGVHCFIDKSIEFDKIPQIVASLP